MQILLFYVYHHKARYLSIYAVISFFNIDKTCNISEQFIKSWQLFDLS